MRVELTNVRAALLMLTVLLLTFLPRQSTIFGFLSYDKCDFSRKRVGPNAHTTRVEQGFASNQACRPTQPLHFCSAGWSTTAAAY